MSVTLLLPANLDALAEIKSYLWRLAKEAGLDQEKLYRLRLAVVELATNIIDYGYGEAKQPGRLRLSARYDDRSFTLFMEDDGQPFDPTALTDPDQCLELDERGVGGQGTFLARHYVDELTYRSAADGNLTTFTIYRECRDEIPH